MAIFKNKIQLSKIKEMLDKRTNFNFKQALLTKELVRLEASFHLKDLPGEDLAMIIVGFESGSCVVEMILDRIDRTYENMALINLFNEKAPFLKAYYMSNEDVPYLKIVGSVAGLKNTKDMVKHMAFFIAELLHNSSFDVLQELCCKTHK